MDLKNFLEKAKDTSLTLTEGRQMFLEMASETRPSIIELKKTVQALSTRINPVLGRIVKIEIMSFQLNSCISDCEKEQDQLYSLFLETFFLLEEIDDEEGLRILSQIKRKYPRALRMLDYQIGNA